MNREASGNVIRRTKLILFRTLTVTLTLALTLTIILTLALTLCFILTLILTLFFRCLPRKNLCVARGVFEINTWREAEKESKENAVTAYGHVAFLMFVSVVVFVFAIVFFCHCFGICLPLCLSLSISLGFVLVLVLVLMTLNPHALPSLTTNPV